MQSPQWHGNTRKEICRDCTLVLYVLDCLCSPEQVYSIPTIRSPGQALSLHLLSRNGNCALYNSNFFFFPLYFCHAFLRQQTVCLTSQGMIRHHLYILAMMMMMMMLIILHYPTRYLYPPLDPARPPTAVA